MRPTEYDSGVLLGLFEQQRIATLEELKEALETTVRMTVLRKLGQLGYRSSYTHGGRYYGLDRFMRFDDQGLWFHRSVGFSRFGTLLRTVEAFVQRGPRGYQAGELDQILRASTKQSLLQLVREGRVVREGSRRKYLYFAVESGKRREQIMSRRIQEDQAILGTEGQIGGVSSDEMKAAIVLFFSLLDEKQRRLYGGLESLKLGYGGDQKIAHILGMDAHTVSKGRKELLGQKVQSDGVRRPGGGRPSVEKKHRK